MSSELKSPQCWIRPEIQALTAYHVPDPGDSIKLDAMENPYSWPEALVDEWLEVLRDVELNRYPDPGARALTARLRETMQVPDGAQIVLGNGSDELIQMLALAVAQPDRVILSPEPAFVMYRMIAEVAGMCYEGVPLADDFSLDLEAMLHAIDLHQPALVFLAYPNNPTGTLFDSAAIETIIERAPGLVVLDEAYAPFTDASFMPRLDVFPNLLVLRTVSKMGLAGLRLGLLAGAPQWLGEIDKTRLPYNINVLTQASALFALEHKAMLDEQAGLIRSERTRMIQALSSLDGVEAYPSEANFVLFRVREGTADAVFNALREQGVLIKNLNPAAGRLTGCLRVTVGTPDENMQFLTALRNAISPN
ncbi:Histidinol-phosphate aminotransferase [hydrothermal vent metagenome]|uniref:Histidinol-phosphate aminotransferase n=1 Tax=hydrothermal vent metagenome TaxID=652676 RepID=A0A3B0YVM3_9ZZZZ